MRSMPPGKLALLALALAQVQRFDSGELTLAALSAEDFEKADAEESYSEGIIDQLRAVQGTKVAALVRELCTGERKGQHKVSLRATDDDVDVSVIARAQGGGGHRRAAGFSTTLELDELIAFLREADRLPAALDARREHGRHARLRPLTAVDGVLLVDKPAGMTSHDVVAAVRARARGRAHGTRGHARPVRDRPAARARGPRDEGPARADGAAQALRDGGAARGGVEHGRHRGGDHRDRTPAARSARAADGRDPPAPADLLGGEDRRRARLPARSSRRALRDARASGDASTASRSSGASPRGSPPTPIAAARAPAARPAPRERAMRSNAPRGLTCAR